jgi:hypothetical protein
VRGKLWRNQSLWRSSPHSIRISTPSACPIFITTATVRKTGIKDFGYEAFHNKRFYLFILLF